ncbi:MAG: hypothetical protein LQ343_006035 [Gyalolechia ehrenbergii]|nr:MAG: hypothetical protein LQ343_006035 [Gyalolechia ehrenbergii]
MNSSHHHDPSSSVNSADAESHHGTPETKLTALSPEDLQFNHFNTAQGTLRSNHPPAFTLGAVPAKGLSKGTAIQSTAAGYQDPFVTTNSNLAAAASGEPPKLSAIAPSFTPLSCVETPGEGIVAHTLMVPVNTSGGVHPSPPGGLLPAPLVPETPYGQVSIEGYLSPVAAGTHFSPSEQTSPSSMRSPGIERQPTKSGQFSSDSPITRSVMISQIDHRTPATDLEAIFNVRSVLFASVATNFCQPHQFQSRKDLVLENLSLTGTVYVSFTDVRDAIEAVTALREVRKDWLVQYLPIPSYGPYYRADRGSSMLASKYEGQLCVKAEFSGPSEYFNLDTMSRLILDLLNNYGDIMAYDALIAIRPVVAYRAEFFDTKNADHAIAHLNGFRIAGCTMSVQHYQGDEPLIVGQEDHLLRSGFRELDLEASRAAWVTPQQRYPLFPPYINPSPHLTATLTPAFFNAQQERDAPRFLVQAPGSGSLQTPYVRPGPPFAMQGRPCSAFNTASFGPGAIGQERISPLSPFDTLHHHARAPFKNGGRHVREHSVGHHNIVDVERIRQGADVRTTVGSRSYCGTPQNNNDQIMLRNIPNKIDQVG